MARSSEQTSEYGTLHDDTELEALALVMGQAFGNGTENARKWLETNRPNARAIRRQGRLMGGLVQIPMGQFFGGRPVSMTGIAGVSIAPAARGRGIATALMQATLRELRRGGAALSALYPATVPLYRRVGYELAGGQYRIRIPARYLQPADRSLPMRPLEPGDLRAVQRLYRGHAATRTGWLDRGNYIWNIVRRARGNAEVHGFVVQGDRQIEGYIFYALPPPGAPLESQSMAYDIHVTDMVSATPRAAHRLLGFLAEQRSLARHVLWHGGTDEPLVHLLPERGCEVALVMPWMLRLLDVRKALAERGYPRHVTARLDLQVTDDLLRANSGRLVLEVAGGTAGVHPGGRGSLKIHVGALAALYSGHLSPHQLAALGMLEGPASALDRAAALFAGPAPSLRDFF